MSNATAGVFGALIGGAITWGVLYMQPTLLFDVENNGGIAGLKDSQGRTYLRVYPEGLSSNADVTVPEPEPEPTLAPRPSFWRDPQPKQDSSMQAWINRGMACTDDHGLLPCLQECDRLEGYAPVDAVACKQGAQMTLAKRVADDEAKEAKLRGARMDALQSIADIISSQMISKGCWTDHSDMTDAEHLRATFRVWFGNDSRFSRSPQLIDPSREPSGDPPMSTFLSYARAALAKCNALGWQVPPEYFKQAETEPLYIDISFLP